jgi:TRAF3-interacting protein 1
VTACSGFLTSDDHALCAPVSDCLLLSLVGVITGTNLTVRPTKVIAGHEPTKTNELLQAIGTALDRKVRTKHSTRFVMSAVVTDSQ